MKEKYPTGQSAMALSKLLLLTISTLASLLVCEVLVRQFHLIPRPEYRSFPEDQPPGLYVPHSIRHYTSASNFAGTINAREYTIQITTNSLGLRDDPIVPGERIDILAAGDSFTMGFGVESEDAWPAQLETNINRAAIASRPVRVLNSAVSAYSLSQIRLSIEDLLYLHPKIVVLGLYPAGYWRLDNPYVYFDGYVVESKKIPYIHVGKDGFLYSEFNNKAIQQVHFWFMDNFYVGAAFLEGARTLVEDWDDAEPDHDKPRLSSMQKMQPLLDEVEKIVQLCRSRDIGLVVLLVNSQSKDGGFRTKEKKYNTIIRRFCRQRRITVFDPIPLFIKLSSKAPVFRIGHDAHWSRRAHALVGKALGAFFRKEDWILRSLWDSDRSESINKKTGLKTLA